MTRQECEAAILGKMQEIVDIYHGYHPDGKYLSLTYLDDNGDGYIQFNNRCWVFDDPENENGEDVDFPINYEDRQEVNKGDGVA